MPADSDDEDADTDVDDTDTDDEDADTDVDTDSDDVDIDADADTFGVAIGVTESELRFLVQVPSEIDSGWTDPEEFQRLVEEVVWDRLDRDDTLRAVNTTAAAGETVSLGTVTLTPDGTVVDASLHVPEP